MKEKTGYVCPYCGAHGTRVFRTFSFSGYVIRYRKCEACDKVHETMEIPMEISKVWRNAAALLLEKRDCISCPELAQNGA